MEVQQNGNGAQSGFAVPPDVLKAAAEEVRQLLAVLPTEAHGELAVRSLLAGEYVKIACSFLRITKDLQECVSQHPSKAAAEAKICRVFAQVDEYAAAIGALVQSERRMRQSGRGLPERDPFTLTPPERVRAVGRLFDNAHVAAAYINPAIMDFWRIAKWAAESIHQPQLRAVNTLEFFQEALRQLPIAELDEIPLQLARELSTAGDKVSEHSQFRLRRNRSRPEATERHDLTPSGPPRLIWRKPLAS